MARIAREKIALVVFAALLFLAAVVTISYLSTVHTFNAAASVVDDTLGRMEGYTVVVYPGTVEKQPDAALSMADAGHSSGADIEISQDEVTDGSEDAAEVRAEESDAINELLSLPGNVVEDDGQLYLSDVRTEYMKKDAQVFTLYPDNLERYAIPFVMRTDGHTIGVFSSPFYFSRPRIEHTVEELKDYGADTIICLTESQDNLATYEGVDAVIVTADQEGVTDGGADRDGSFIVETPARGSIGALVITAGNVLTTRVINPS